MRIHEAVSEWFEEDDAVQFMMQVYSDTGGKTATHSGSGLSRRVGTIADPPGAPVRCITD